MHNSLGTLFHRMNGICSKFIRLYGQHSPLFIFVLNWYKVRLEIQEIKKPDLVASLVAENVALQLERRIAFRRAMKKAVQTTMSMGAEGIRIQCAGRLAGADIARTEQLREGRVPLHTLRENIDYGLVEANTVYGIIGIKCWICLKDEDKLF